MKKTTDGNKTGSHWPFFVSFYIAATIAALRGGDPFDYFVEGLLIMVCALALFLSLAMIIRTFKRF